MKTAIISSADLASQPGAPLSAEYWVNRHEGESWPQYERRAAIERELALAGRHAARLQATLDRVSALVSAEVRDG